MLFAEKKLPSEPIGDRSVQLLSYILYIRPVRSRPQVFAGVQALWYEAHSRCDMIEDVSQDIKTYPAL
ncbi:hypothetical protein [Microcoleus asticus]|uniref:Uncharacterized protein n=1 Tax=Microcoleus asticus IPMA8 TaxID=2563858 RepID=A0ABX2D0U0_9CYAN|nr:hypothetical protein [Microcoleus asticus]NQE36267.1 hypothetical protein [Microcoleus asticus IPMA8]